MKCRKESHANEDWAVAQLRHNGPKEKLTRCQLPCQENSEIMEEHLLHAIYVQLQEGVWGGIPRSQRCLQASASAAACVPWPLGPTKTNDERTCVEESLWQQRERKVEHSRDQDTGGATALCAMRWYWRPTVDQIKASTSTSSS